MTLHSNDPQLEPNWLPPGQPIEVPQRQLLRRIGCSETVRPSTRTLRGLRTAAAAVVEHARPAATWRSYPVRTGQVERGRALVDGRIVLQSKKLARVLDHCVRMYVFVVTLGAELDALIEKSLRRRQHFGLLLDTAASLAAEHEADRLMDRLGGALGPGMGLTSRYSPGYCDWALHEQRKLYALLPKYPAGTELSPDHLMSPRKSVSGIVGVGPDQAVSRLGCACHSCTRSDCEHRRS